MTTDILWAIERQHEKGTWHTVMTQAWFLAEAPNLVPGLLSLNHPASMLGLRDTGLFALLSEACAMHARIAPAEAVALPGFPEDIAPATRDYLEHRLPRRGSCPWGHGHFTLERLRRISGNMVVATRKAACPGYKIAIHERVQAMQALSAFRRNLEEVAADASLMDSVLLGPAWICGQEEVFPHMRNLSAHQEIRIRAISRGLVPVSGETLRVCVAFKG